MCNNYMKQQSSSNKFRNEKRKVNLKANPLNRIGPDTVLKIKSLHSHINSTLFFYDFILEILGLDCHITTILFLHNFILVTQFILEIL